MRCDVRKASAERLTNHESFDHIRVNVVKFRWVLALFAKDARSGSFDVIRLVWRSRTAVAVNAFDVLATASVLTRCHACNKTEKPNLLSGWLVAVNVGALVVVGTLLSEVMDIAHLHLLDAVNLRLFVVFARRVDTLSCSVPCNELLTISRPISWRCRGWRGRSGCLGGPAAHEWYRLGTWCSF